VCWDYAQSLEELLVEVQVPGSTADQDVAVQISQQHLLVTVQQVPVIDAPLAGQVLPQCSSWQLGEYLESSSEAHQNNAALRQCRQQQHVCGMLALICWRCGHCTSYSSWMFGCNGFAQLK
jgi:hypothetical protein